ncbi:hypothetical protein E2C01_080332 [Portunus trituberculatus]|uniref:Uncharacterized protein n=1 Tax=Portunus trituberculatus TaxID=210409 RepID=A0A5B7IJF2_PORTR|nr:hypothetical protein [Portunus trituberculatus]
MVTVVSAVAAALSQEGITMNQEIVQWAAIVDPSYQLLPTRVLANDWPAHRDEEITCLHPYYAARDCLATMEGLVTYTFEYDSVRPGNLQHHRSTCLACETHAPYQSQEQITLTPPPEYLFQKTVLDLFQLDGRQYMAYADRLTG